MFYLTLTKGINELDKRKNYNLAGIRNTSEMRIPYNRTSKMCQRFGVLLPSYEQAIVEVWHDSNRYETRFSKNWTQLDFVVVKNVTYHGRASCGSRDVHVFRQGHKMVDRMCWVSAENFWMNPIQDVEKNDYENKVVSVQGTFPNLERGEGFLRRCTESTPKTFQNAELFKIHSTDRFSINTSQEYKFKDFEKLALSFKKIMRNVRTGPKIDLQRDQECLFNKYVNCCLHILGWKKIIH